MIIQVHVYIHVYTHRRIHTHRYNDVWVHAPFIWLMVAVVTCNNNLVPLLECLHISNPWRFDHSGFWIFAKAMSTSQALCVSLYMYIDTYIHTCGHTCKHVHVYIHTYIHIRTNIQTYRYNDIDVHTHFIALSTSQVLRVSLYVYIHTDIYANVYIHTYIHTDVFMHTYIPTYTHTHTYRHKC